MYEPEYRWEGDKVVAVRVLNGWCHVGDQVAVAYRDGNTAEMRVGYVTEFRVSDRTYFRSDARIVRIRYTARHESYPYWNPESKPETFGTEMHNRVAVLFEPTAAEKSRDLAADLKHELQQTLPFGGSYDSGLA